MALNTRIIPWIDFRHALSVVLSTLGLLAAGSAAADVSPNDFKGSDVQRINQAIEVAAERGEPVVIPRINRSADGDREVWLLDSAILVRNDTYLELQNCHLKLSDQSRDNMVRSANCGMGITDIQPLSNVTIIGKGRVILEGLTVLARRAIAPRRWGSTYGTDAGVAGESQTGDWRNIGILLAYVDHFRIENVLIQDAHCWAISLERCRHGIVRDIEFSADEGKEVSGRREVFLNQDGLDLRQGCQDIDIANISGHTGDDLIALTNIANASQTSGSPDSTMVSTPNNRGDGQDDISNITIRNIRGYTAGGHHLVRLLNASGLQIHDVILDGLIDTSTDRAAKAAVKIGDSNPAWGGVTPLGDTYRIVINNVISRAQHTILIGGSLAESSISNVIKYEATGEPITYSSGPQYIRNLMIENIKTMSVAPAHP